MTNIETSDGLLSTTENSLPKFDELSADSNQRINSAKKPENIPTVAKNILFNVNGEKEKQTFAQTCTKLDLQTATDEQLMRCKRHWKSLLDQVESAIDEKKTSRGKRFSPISPSLPDRESAFVLDRLNSLQVTEEEELIRNSKPSETIARTYRRPFDPKRNNTVEECKRLSQQELVTELKQRGTYNPDLMAWDATGVIRFLDRSIVDQYERQLKRRANRDETAERNVEALERILAELHLRCDVREPSVLTRLRNLTSSVASKTVISPSIRMTETEMRSKRQAAEELINSFEKSRSKDAMSPDENFGQKRQKLIGDVHVLPFGCDKRASVEDGYLRLCGACQAIRRLPDTFFPPFINEVMCDDDKACLYFYNFRRFLYHTV